MHEDELKVRVELPKCGDEDCDCAALEDHFEGTVQEVLQKVYDDTIERDKNLMLLITDQAETIVALYQIVEALAPQLRNIGPSNLGGFDGTLN